MSIDETIRTDLPWHLRDNWAPVLDERTDFDLRVEGTIPPELAGTYMRTGPNPLSGRSDHWFFGDGMVHGVRIAGGKAEWYRNRFVADARTSPNPAGDAMSNMGDLTRGTGNTSIHQHNGKLLCLEEGHWPWQIDGELNTVGYENFGGALTCSMTAHPKVDPVTGELIAFSYLSPEPPFLHYIRISADGVVQQIEGIDIPNMVMMHDFNVTQNYVVFMDLPVCFDLGALETGMPFMFDRDAGARLGVMPRNGTNADVRWFEIDPCYVFHPVNAHEVGQHDRAARVASARGVRLEQRRLRRGRPALALDDRPRPRHGHRAADRRSPRRLRPGQRPVRRARRAVRLSDGDGRRGQQRGAGLRIGAVEVRPAHRCLRRAPARRRRARRRTRLRRSRRGRRARTRGGSSAWSTTPCRTNRD